ncbi:unnamed protein product, partial [Vitis vinifera]
MECNKDEASRAKDIAVRKFREKDFLGAKKFVLKAQNLYPGLEGLSQMLTILDVYISAEKKVSGEVDWYGILGVSPLADEETVKKQYRKLALILHPDKNKSIGADGAFKLVSEAWSLLSDKGKRLSYNQKRDVKGSQQKVPSQNGVPSAPASANGVHNFTSEELIPSGLFAIDARHSMNISGFISITLCFVPIVMRRFWLWRRLHLQMFQNHPSGLPASILRVQIILKRREVVRKRIDDDGTNGYGGNIVNQTATGNGGTGAPNSYKEMSLFEIRNMLMEKARKEIRNKLSEWSSTAAAKAGNKEKEKVKLKEKQKGAKFSPGTSAADTDSEAPAPMAINVPDSDFHDFDLDRTESSFGDNQVWSAYDDDDGMPRFYALIHKVISLKPFKMKISWLNSKSNSEFGSGDVWALYRNWSPDWNENTPDEVIHKYDMVEVLDDYNEDYGVSVTPLIKVAGFRTIFHRHEDPKEVRTVLREEMFCFSHQVPNRLLTGQEAQNAPKGCRELDPAATPLELLQIITEATEAPVVNVGKDEEGRLQSAQQIKLDKMVDYAAKSNDGEIVENSEQIKSEEIMGHAKVAREAGGG